MSDINQNQPVTQTRPNIPNLGRAFTGGSVKTNIQSDLQDNSQSNNQNNTSQISNQVANTTPVQQDDTTQKLDAFEEVLDQIQNTVPHGIVQAVDDATDTLNVKQGVSRTAKERVETGTSPDLGQVDSGSGVQMIEHEKNPEIPVEVESYLQRVEDHHETAPTEVVIADGTHEIPSNQYPSKPVVVLPITEEDEKDGAKKSPKFSFRWLVEFSHKIIKMFTGKVVYRQEDNV